MIKNINGWIFYKKMLQWLLYAVITFAAVTVLYFTVEYFFEQTVMLKVSQYHTHQTQYTSDPGQEVTPMDKNKWKKNNSVDRGWDVPYFIQGYVHPLVTITISLIIVIAIIGGIVVFRNQHKERRL